MKYAYQTFDVVLDQNPPVLGTAHEVFAETGGVELKSIIVRQQNTPVNPAEIDIIIIKDGTTYETDPGTIGNLANLTVYSVQIFKHNLLAYGMEITAIAASGFMHNAIAGFVAANQGFSDDPFCGHDITVQVRQDSAIDVGARIYCECVYDLLVMV